MTPTTSHTTESRRRRSSDRPHRLHPAPIAGPDARRGHEGPGVPQRNRPQRAAGMCRGHSIGIVLGHRPGTGPAATLPTIGVRTTVTAPHRRPPGAHPPTSRQKLTRAKHIPERGSDADDGQIYLARQPAPARRRTPDSDRHRPVGEIQPEDLPGYCCQTSGRTLSALESIERDAIIQALRDAGGNRVQAAATLGIARSSLYRKLTSFGIEVD